MAILKNTPEKAMRYARYIVQDIGMYNKKKVEEAIMADSFFESLEMLLAEGREQYESQVTPKIVQDTNYFDCAVIDVLLYRKRHLSSPIWD